MERVMHFATPEASWKLATGFRLPFRRRVVFSVAMCEAPVASVIGAPEKGGASGRPHMAPGATGRHERRHFSSKMRGQIFEGACGAVPARRGLRIRLHGRTARLPGGIGPVRGALRIFQGAAGIFHGIRRALQGAAAGLHGGTAELPGVFVKFQGAPRIHPGISGIFQGIFS